MKSKKLFLIVILALLISQVAIVEAQEPLSTKEIYGTQANLSNNDVSTLAVPTVLTNGNFESGAVGWTEYSFQGWALIGQPGGNSGLPSPHSGTWYAWLGGDYSETAILSQSVTISADAPNLRLWYYTYSQHTCSQDYGYVKIDSTTVHTWNLCSATNTGSWTALDLDLSAYNGQTVSLQISAMTTASTWSDLFIDDVIFYGTFADVSADHWAWQYIESIYNAGVTGGCGTAPLIYCPTNTVTRAQMAVFLLKAEHGSAYVPPVATGVFSDVPTSFWAADWIEQLANEGITGGCGGGNYCPNNAVSRAQMAVFLLKAEHGSAYVPPSATGVFGDVPTSHWAADWIEQLANEAITGGCGGGNYCPNNSVNRAQMGVFLQKTFNLALP